MFPTRPKIDITLGFFEIFDELHTPGKGPPCPFDFWVFEPKEDIGRSRSCEEFSSGGLIPSWVSDYIEDGGKLVDGVDLRGMVPMYPGREPPVPPKVAPNHVLNAALHPQVSRLWGWLDPKSTAKGPAFQPEEFLKQKQTEDILAAAREFNDAWLKSRPGGSSMSSSTLSLESQPYASSGYESQSEPASPEAGYQVSRGGSLGTPTRTSSWVDAGSVPSSGYASRSNSEPSSPEAGYQLSRGESPRTPTRTSSWAGSVPTSGYASRYNSEPPSPEAGYQVSSGGSPRTPTRTFSWAGSVPSSGYASRYNSEPSSPEAGYQMSRGASPGTPTRAPSAVSVSSSGYASRYNSEPSSPEAGYQMRSNTSLSFARNAAPTFWDVSFSTRTPRDNYESGGQLNPPTFTNPNPSGSHNEYKMCPNEAKTIAENFVFTKPSEPALIPQPVKSSMNIGEVNAGYFSDALFSVRQAIEQNMNKDMQLMSLWKEPATSDVNEANGMEGYGTEGQRSRPLSLPIITTQSVLKNEIQMHLQEAQRIAENSRFIESSLPTQQTQLAKSSPVQIPNDVYGAANMYGTWNSMDVLACENDPMYLPHPEVEVLERDHELVFEESKSSRSTFIGVHGGAGVVRMVQPVADFKLFSNFVYVD